MAIAQYKTDAESGKGTLRASFIATGGGPAACRGTWHRTSVEDPLVPECPVFYSCVCNGVGGAGGCGNGGIGGDNGDIHVDISEASRLSGYENGNATGWICVDQ